MFLYVYLYDVSKRYECLWEIYIFEKISFVVICAESAYTMIHRG